MEDENNKNHNNKKPVCMYVTFFPESGVCTTVSRFPFSHFPSPVSHFPSIVFRYPLVDPSVLFLFKKWGEEEEEEKSINKSIYGSPHFSFSLSSLFLFIC